MAMLLGVLCVGIFVLAGCQGTIDNPVTNTSSSSVNIPRINFIVGGSYIFGEWKPPISLATSFTPGQQVPVKFTVLDENGNPAKTGVDATILIGNVVSGPAVIDDSTIGQWVTNITLPGVGTYDVVLIGNVKNVTPLTITIEVAVPQGNTGTTPSGSSCGGGCNHYNDRGNCGGGVSNGGNCGNRDDNSHNGCDNEGDHYNDGNCGNRGDSHDGHGNGNGNNNSGNCGNRGNTNNGCGNDCGNSNGGNGGNCGNRGNTNNGYGNNGSNGCGNYR